MFDTSAGTRVSASMSVPRDRIPRAMGRTEIVRDSRPWGVGRTGPGSLLGSAIYCRFSTPHPRAGPLIRLLAKAAGRRSVRGRKSVSTVGGVRWSQVGASLRPSGTGRAHTTYILSQGCVIGVITTGRTHNHQRLQWHLKSRTPPWCSVATVKTALPPPRPWGSRCSAGASDQDPRP